MCRPCWKQHSAVWRWRGADDERTRTAAHRPGAGGGGQIRCRPPFPPDRCHDPADRRLWHLQGQKTPAAAESPGEKKRPDPLHRFRCRRVPHPHLHHRSGGGRKRGAGLCARHPWQGKAEAPARQGRPAGRGRRGRYHRPAMPAGCTGRRSRGRACPPGGSADHLHRPVQLGAFRHPGQCGAEIPAAQRAGPAVPALQKRAGGGAEPAVQL